VIFFYCYSMLHCDNQIKRDDDDDDGDNNNNNITYFVWHSVSSLCCITSVDIEFKVIQCYLISRLETTRRYVIVDRQNACL